MNLETCLSDVDLEKSEVLFFFAFLYVKNASFKKATWNYHLFFSHEGDDYVIHTVHTHKQEIDQVNLIQHVQNCVGCQCWNLLLQALCLTSTSGQRTDSLVPGPSLTSNLFH